VHYRQVQAVAAAVLDQQLPVAAVDAGVGAADDLETLLRLVGEHVDDFGEITQVLAQRWHVGIQAAEDEAAIALHPRHGGQVVARA